MTRWPSQLLLLLSVAAALQLLVHHLPATANALCVGAAPPGNDTVELYPDTVPPNRTPLVIGYLTAIKGELKDKQGLAISGALSMALDEINRDRYLLPNVTLQMRWNDTRGDTVLATRAMTDMICDGVVSFFGPEGPCYVEAIVSQSRNIPMISYKCSDYKASSIPTFARTEPPDTQVTKSVISLLMYYGWRKFSIVYEEPWTTVANSMKEQALARNMTLNHLEPIVDNHKCCETMLPCCRIGFWFSLIQNTLNRTRIYVFLGTSTALVNMMSSMDDHSLFDKGEYMVIFVDMMTYSESTATQYLWKTEQVSSMTSCNQDLLRFRKRAQSLLVVVSTAPSENYTNFMNNVRAHNNKAPFYFTTPKLFWQYDKFISISAAYLYDSIKLYAWALDKLLRAQPGPLTSDIIRNVSLDGQRIIETIIANRTYKSVTGATIKIDKNGDSEGNFSVLALTAHSYTFPDKNITCDSYMYPVAYFTQGDDFPEYKIIDPQIRINWPGTEKPADQPFCGFHDELCPKDDSQITSLIIACTLGLGLFCVTVIALSMYRKWKIELEIEGLLWRIEPDEIKGFNFNMNCDIVASPSKLSLVSAQSFGSRCSNQVFTTTGRYKGMVVRMKELKYARKKDISRDIMKEMRLLRDLRHDNINSFIGAVVEPMRTLLVTDYCAKGSLYDIVENEDIKLDEMFIASLVHDLIKGMMYIHASALDFHGNLKSSNCVVTSRWMLQVSDFGLHDLRHCAESESIGEHQYYRNQFWKAPELLREPRTMGSKKADVYAFAIILFEMIGRKGPFGQIQLEPKDIVERVKRRPDADAGEEPFRPEISYILDSSICADYIVSCIKESWDENPEVRPEFTLIRQRLKKMRGGKSRNIMDQIMELMEKYANNLEDVVNERTRQLCDEKRKTEDLLHRMLPESVADSLTRGLGVEPVSYNSVTIYFSDIVGFTALSAVSTPLQVVNFLNDLYTLFDRVIKGYDVYKVETIGDAYMVVSGLPIKNDERHVGEIASMSLDLLYAIRHHRIAHRPQEVLKLRVGMHTGPVVAGVVGLTMPRYCLFGDTVNTASRMESNGEALRIHISTQCKEALDRLGGYVTEDRGRIQMKGKGEVQTYWLVGATEEAVQRREVNLGDLPPLFSRPRYSPGRQMAADSRQGSTMGLQYFGSRRQSSSVMQRAEAVSMYSLQGALISSTSFAGQQPQPLPQQQPPPPNRLDSPHSSSQRRINRTTPILLACDSTAGVAHAVSRILDGDGNDDDDGDGQHRHLDNGTGSHQSFADCDVDDSDDDDADVNDDTARPSDRLLLASRQPIYQFIPPQSHSELIRKPLLIRPSQSMDHFPATSAAASATSAASAANGLNHRSQQPMVSRLRKRVDSAISLVSTARHGGTSARNTRALQFAARNRSSRSLDAGCGVAGAPEATVALIGAAERLQAPVNGDDSRQRENGGAAAAAAAPGSEPPATTDLGTLYKPYLNNNCNGGNGGAPGSNAAAATGQPIAASPAADNDNPNCPLLLHHHHTAHSNGPSATFAAVAPAGVVTSTTASTVLHPNRTVTVTTGNSPPPPPPHLSYASEAHAKRWHSLDPMGDGYAAAAAAVGDHHNSADDAPLDGSKKPLAGGAHGQRGGSLRTWLLGLFGVGGGRTARGGGGGEGGGGGGGGGRGGAIIVPAGRMRGVATVGFGERSSQPGTPDTESIV